MKRINLLFLTMICVINCLAQAYIEPINNHVILSPTQRPHVVESYEPIVTFTKGKFGTLSIRLDSSHYSAYTITLTASDGASSTITPTSGAVSIVLLVLSCCRQDNR